MSEPVRRPDAASADELGSTRLRTRLAPFLSFIVFVLALAALRKTIGAYSFDEVQTEFQNLPADQLAASFGLTALSYLLLTVFDWQGARLAGRRIATQTLLLTAFIANAFGHTLGMAALTGGAVRLRGYGAAGMTAGEIAHVIASASLGFIIGALLLLGLALSIHPYRAALALHVAPLLLQIIGAACLLTLAAGAAALALGKRAVVLRGHTIALPSLGQGVLQLLVSLLELLCAAGALYAVLPPEADVTFLGFCGIWTIGVLAGLVSTVPGGLGVFEATLLLLMPQVAAHSLLSAILAYRVTYYLAPLLIATTLLVGQELARPASAMRRGATRMFGWTQPLVVPAFALAVFAAGAMLLVSGAIPLGPERRDLAASFVPLSILELSHLSASMLGVLLLVLARGLYLKLDAAWAITLLALIAGAITSLLAAFHWEQALVLSMIAVPLWAARRRFYRPASLFDEPFTWGWIRDIALVVTGAIWLGFFAQRHVEYADRLWWDFAFASDAPRMLRASLAAVSLLIGLGLYKLLRPAADAPAVASAQEIERARAIIGADSDSGAHLALTGDKQLLFAESARGFLMFQRSGGSLVAMGDPVGEPSAHRELIWKFREMADLQGLRPVFYQVSAAHLADYVDLGLMLTKLGEEAIVPLADFNLEGRDRADLRSAARKAERDGIAFEVIAADQIAQNIRALDKVSREWLATRESAEKGFSVGYFDRAYLERFPCAIARRGATIVAFANLWPCAEHGELSVDLMRYADDAPPGIMDFLLSQLMLWGKAHGYTSFSLGMAPLAGLSRHRLAPSWHKLGDFIWRYGGAFYHFEGLRKYKQKFRPEWRPRYLASPGGLSLPRALIDVARLIAGGTRAMFRK